MQNAPTIARELPTDRVPQLRLFRVRLDRAMKARGLNEYGLAKAIGCSRSSINHYLCGNRLPNSEAIVLLASTLQVSTDWLLGFACHADGKPTRARDTLLEVPEGELDDGGRQPATHTEERP